MKYEQISKRSLPILAALGLILATAVAMSAPPRGGPVELSEPELKCVPLLGTSSAGVPQKALLLQSSGTRLRAQVPAPVELAARGPRPRPVVRPAPAVRARAVVRPVPGVRVRVAPRVGLVVVPRYRPRPLVWAGAAAAVVGGAPVVAQVAPSVVAAAAEPVVVPSQESAQAKAYQVVSVADDYTLTLLIDGRQTPVRLLGVDPLLVAESEGQPGVVPEDALRFVRNLLLGEPVYLADDPQVAATDADGVRVAYVHRAPDGLLVNLEIIRQGYGLSADAYAFQHQEAFGAYQTRAQALGKGIWRGLQAARTAD
jgi:micrococcal nuclease